MNSQEQVGIQTTLSWHDFEFIFMFQNRYAVVRTFNVFIASDAL